MKRYTVLLFLVTSCAFAQFGSSPFKRTGGVIQPKVPTDTLSIGGTVLTFHLTTVTHSGTPTFNLSLGNVFKVVMQENETATVSNQTAGQLVSFIVCQDGSGNHTFAWPVNVKGGMTVGAIASTCNAQSFVADGTNLYAVSAGVVNQ
jgi:hypothetical protein